MNKGMGWALALACVTFTGCTQWQPGSGYSFAVFSETGDSVAAVFQNYEQKNNVTHLAKKNHESQVVLADNAGNLTPITGFLDGNVVELFYQEEAEFVIVARRGDTTEDSNGNEVGWVKVDHVTLEGEVTSLASATGIIMLTCDGGTSSTSTNLLRRVIPNPAGTVLASIESTTTCSDRVQSLTFLDAQTLAPLQAPIALDDGAPDAGGFPGPLGWAPQEMAWMENGTFAVSSWVNSPGPDLYSAQVYQVGSPGMTEEVIGISCFFPATASYSTSIHGEDVSIASESGELSFTNYGLTAGYGCDNP